MKRVRAGVTCPACGQGCYEYTDWTLSEHKTPYFVPGQPPGGKVRERCVYSGGTWADAKAKITPWRRKVLDDNARWGAE